MERVNMLHKAICLVQLLFHDADANTENILNAVNKCFIVKSFHPMQIFNKCEYFYLHFNLTFFTHMFILLFHVSRLLWCCRLGNTLNIKTSLILNKDTGKG